uniref:Uncharacterized protein n=1 Tax=Glossina austeni TaxID=7395 RepID=A0A1A9VF27_GLOAU
MALLAPVKPFKCLAFLLISPLLDALLRPNFIFFMKLVPDDVILEDAEIFGVVFVAVIVRPPLKHFVVETVIPSKSSVKKSKPNSRIFSNNRCLSLSKDAAAGDKALLSVSSPILKCDIDCVGVNAVGAVVVCPTPPPTPTPIALPDTTPSFNGDCKRELLEFFNSSFRLDFRENNEGFALVKELSADEVEPLLLLLLLPPLLQLLLYLAFWLSRSIASISSGLIRTFRKRFDLIEIIWFNTRCSNFTSVAFVGSSQLEENESFYIAFDFSWIS